MNFANVLVVVGDSLRIGIQQGLFALPTNGDTPLIGVGPGTGIAPLRAVIEDRVHEGIHGKLTVRGARTSMFR